ncbi:hypothetical protein CUMW_104960 [Citrus unshiu]|uniref:Armadillo-like repeats domain-containing protein n=1 Tax=Citrus unshiu TaxID=55188 RepID=A0A2H5P550_CITUN|nr:hypothetical protein CUMW_104960 [Citrus unshiu]
MASLATSSSFSSLQFLPRPKIPQPPFSSPSLLLPQRRTTYQFSSLVVSAQNDKKSTTTKEVKKKAEEVEVEVEEELPWIQEKALDLVEFTGSVTQAIPGPRVGQSKLPWILAVPLAYVGVSFVIAFVKTVKKFNSPKFKRKKLVNKNAMVCKTIDELFQKGGDAVNPPALKGLVQKTGFSMEDVLRKYIRYALNEKPFNPDLVVNLIQLRKASMLDDSQVAEILNEISRRIVREKDEDALDEQPPMQALFVFDPVHNICCFLHMKWCKSPVVMNMSGYSEKGFKRKLAVQALFGKVFYLSELPEFCSRDSSLIVKEIFGVTDEDADKLRQHTLSEAGDMDSLEKMVNDSDSEENSNENSSDAAP